MSTSKAAILATVDFLSAGLADQTSCARLYDEVVIQLGQDIRCWLATAEVQSTGTDAEKLPITDTTLVRLLALYMNGKQLSRETIAHLNAANPRWEGETGTPWAFFLTGQDDRTVRLYPKPDQQALTDTFSSYTSAPIVIGTNLPTTAIPDVLELPIVLMILAREFERESNHRDQAAAAIWDALGQDLLDKVY